jgi:hypothetical protein
MEAFSSQNHGGTPYRLMLPLPLPLLPKHDNLHLLPVAVADNHKSKEGCYVASRNKKKLDSGRFEACVSESCILRKRGKPVF